MAVPVPEVLNDPPIATGGCDPSRATTATGKLANLKINVGGNKFLFQEINGRDYQYPSQADHNLMLTDDCFVPTGYFDFAELMNSNKDCKWGLSIFYDGKWTPVKEQPSWRNISVNYPDDDAINNLRYILGTFVDPISCQYSKDFADKCLLAYHMSIDLHTKVTALKDEVKRLEEAPVTRGRYNLYGPIYRKSKKISKEQTAYSTGELMNVDAGSSGMMPLVKDMGLGK
ncbi:hypothetical protein H2248_002980 [Termitomyces sp. 'cryptogamus']|nr:hypothetical protein H2248_002980 [Termitomyces sp. 'cryptogamus']